MPAGRCRRRAPPPPSIVWQPTQFLNDQNTLTLDSFSLVNLAASYVHRQMQYNLSMPIPNEMIEGVAKEIAERKK